MPEPDDAQSGETTDSGVAADQTSAATTEDQETPETTEQSTETEGKQTEEGGEKKYKLPDGREVTSDELYDVYSKNLLPEFTRRSQKLAELEKAQKEREAQAEEETQRAIKDNELLKNVHPDVKEAIGQIVKPLIDQSIQQRDQTEAQRQRDQAFETKLRELEDKYDGKNHPVKFDRFEVIQALQDPNNTNFDPESKFKELHEAEFRDIWVKDALKKQKGGTDTERTGQAQDRKPQGKVPKTFEQARQSAFSRLRSS